MQPAARITRDARHCQHNTVPSFATGDFTRLLSVLSLHNKTLNDFFNNIINLFQFNPIYEVRSITLVWHAPSKHKVASWLYACQLHQAAQGHKEGPVCVAAPGLYQHQQDVAPEKPCECCRTEMAYRDERRTRASRTADCELPTDERASPVSEHMCAAHNTAPRIQTPAPRYPYAAPYFLPIFFSFFDNYKRHLSSSDPT